MLSEEVKERRREIAELEKQLEESERRKDSEAQATQGQQTMQAARCQRSNSSPLSSLSSELPPRELPQGTQMAPKPNGNQKRRNQPADAEDSEAPQSPARLKRTQKSMEDNSKEQNHAPKRKRGRPRGSVNKRPALPVDESRMGISPEKLFGEAPRARRHTQSSTSKRIPTVNQTRPLEQLEASGEESDANEHPDPDEEFRQDTEPGKIKKHQPTKDEKKELNRVSQELLRKHKKLLENGGLKWGDYSTEFHHPAEAEDLYEFLLVLDQAADYAHTWPDEMLQRAKTREGFGGRLNEWMWHKVLKENFARDTDVICVDGMADLEQALGREFRKPIFHRASKNTTTSEDTNSLVDSEGFGLSGFLADRKENHPGAKIDVHDMREDDTVKRNIQILFDAFKEDISVPTPLNFLSLQNLTQQTFCPKAITDINLRCRIERMQARKVAQRWKSAHEYTSPEFFIASTPNTISPIHVDSGGGNTWVSILEGRKIWYFPRVVEESTVRLLDSFDNLHPEDYPGGWVKVELRKGDVLIMPPSFPHAVFTPERSLAVGGQFYTAAHLRRSLRGVVQQRMMSRVSNDKLGDEQYANLAAVLGPAVDGLLSPMEKRLVSAEILHVLNDVPEWDRWEESQQHDQGDREGAAGSEDDADADDVRIDDEQTEGEDETDGDGDDGDYSKDPPPQSKAKVPGSDSPVATKPKRVSQRVQARNARKPFAPARKVSGKPSGVSRAGKNSRLKGKKPYKCSLPKTEVDFVRAVSIFRVRNPVTRD